jgi:hypothetical protein
MFIEEHEAISSVDSLAFLIVNTSLNVFSYNMDFLEDEEDFCYKCIYNKMDIVRKAISRYLRIETEKSEFTSLISLARDKFNEWCMFISTTYDMKTPERHVRVINPYYLAIQEELELEDEDDEDDNSLLN